MDVVLYVFWNYILGGSVSYINVVVCSFNIESFVTILRDDISDAAGALQFCAGQISLMCSSSSSDATVVSIF